MPSLANPLILKPVTRSPTDSLTTVGSPVAEIVTRPTTQTPASSGCGGWAQIPVGVADGFNTAF